MIKMLKTLGAVYIYIYIYIVIFKNINSKIDEMTRLVVYIATGLVLLACVEK